MRQVSIMAGILLSELELTMLRDPGKLKTRQKRNLSYRLKTRGSEIGKVLQEIELLIKNIPEEALKEAVSNETFKSLKTILETLLQVRAPWPVGVDGEEKGAQVFKVFGNATPSDAPGPGLCSISSISREATYEEMELDSHLTELHNNLRRYIDPCTPDPVCYTLSGGLDEAFKSLGVYKSIGALNKNFSIKYNNYEDEVGTEKGADNSLWVVTKPALVETALLPWMRWKPRDLGECIEQPPLLKERKLSDKRGASSLP